VDPKERATLDEVKNHSWVREGHPDPVENHLPARVWPSPGEINMDVVERMKAFGYASETVLAAFHAGPDAKKMNPLVTTYFLLSEMLARLEEKRRQVELQKLERVDQIRSPRSPLPIEMDRQPTARQRFASVTPFSKPPVVAPSSEKLMINVNTGLDLVTKSAPVSAVPRLQPPPAIHTSANKLARVNQPSPLSPLRKLSIAMTGGSMPADLDASSRVSPKSPLSPVKKSLAARLGVLDRLKATSAGGISIDPPQRAQTNPTATANASPPSPFVTQVETNEDHSRRRSLPTWLPFARAPASPKKRADIREIQGWCVILFYG
jgi:hypothetical protein